MATIPSPPTSTQIEAEAEYPTGDGRPVAETPVHYTNLKNAVEILERHFAKEPLVYTWGNMLVHYEKGNKRKHVSPDVFVAVGVPKDTPREAYFTWIEGHGLDFVIELTSRSTKGEDIDDKMSIYQDVIGVTEYFLFDPKGEYLDPPLQGHRLRKGKYVRIKMVDGRLPSDVVGLHLERDGEWLRFYNPITGRWLPTSDEMLHDERAKRKRAEAKRKRAETERQRAGTERQRAETERQRLAAELRASTQETERLRRELDEWRRRSGERPG